MSIETLLAVVSGATLVYAVAGWVRQVLVRIEEGEAAKTFVEGADPGFVAGDDPRQLNEYLFTQAGSLSLREYATDPDVRDVIGRAVSNIDDLLDAPSAETPPHTLGVEQPASPHLQAAVAALRRGDSVGALARLRLWIELELQQFAEMADAPLRQRGPSRAIRPLAKQGFITGSEANTLSSAVRIANAAVHGETVSVAAAQDAIESTAEVIRAIQRRAHHEPSSDA